MESDMRLIRALTTESESFKVIRRAYFTTILDKRLPVISFWLNFLAWRHEIEVINGDYMDSGHENLI